MFEDFEDYGPPVEPEINTEALQSFLEAVNNWKLPDGCLWLGLTYSSRGARILVRMDICIPEIGYEDKLKELQEWLQTLPLENQEVMVDESNAFGFYLVSIVGSYAADRSV